VKLLLIPALCLPLAACDLNPLMGEPSEFQKYRERLSAVEAKLAAPVVASVSEPVTASVSMAAIEPVHAPSCHETFRVNRCGENGEILPW
jgi:hypothetical protein